ncbi:MAG: PA2778 family cysteine peptidase [Woeseiaceae bacterium]
MLVLAGVSLSAGCSTLDKTVRADLLEKSGSVAFELSDTAFYPQTTDQCGPAALATVLNAAGVQISPVDLAPSVYLPNRKGSLQIELMAATRSFGRIPYPVEDDVVSLLAEIQQGHPVLVLQNLGASIMPIWHFAVVIGYLPAEEQFVLRSGDVRRHLIPASKFLRSWRRANSWGIVVLQPGDSPANRDMETYVRAVADLEAVGQTEAAALGYETAVNHWPKNSIAWLGMGNTNYSLGRLELAQIAFFELLRIEPANVVALNNLALVLAASGNFDDAIETVDTALSLTEPANALHTVISQTRSEILEKTGTF